MKKKFLRVVLVCSLLLVGCSTGKNTAKSNEASDKKKEFTISVSQEMPTADLSAATDTISLAALTNVYEGLYRLGKDNTPEPAGASKLASVSKDGLTYNFKLRKDAKWSNGEPVTAKDYVFSWQRIVSPETAAQYANLFEIIENAKDITAGKKDKETLGVKAINDYELEVNLNQATPYFNYLVAYPPFFPQNEETFKKHGDKYATTTETSVYNGPFTLEDFDGPGVDTKWHFEKNDNYWDKDAVQIDGINFNVVKEASTAYNLFKDGASDDVILSGEMAKQMKKDPEYVVVSDARTQYIEANQKDGSPFQNKNLRKAISYSIDRNALVNSVIGDGSTEPAGLIPRDFVFNPENDKDFTDETGVTIEYDPEKAKDYWEKAKKELDIDKLEVSMLSSDTDSSKTITEYIKNSVEQTLADVKIELNPVPFTVRIDRSAAGDFDLVLGGWGADYMDASALANLFLSDNSNNHGEYNNEKYDAQLEAAATTNANDPEKRWENLLNAERIIMDDQGVIPVFQVAESHLRSKEVKGIVSHPAGTKYDYKWVTIEN